MKTRYILPALVVCAFLTGCNNTMRVMANGLGSGRIVSTPTGLNCADECQAVFSEGATITLTATPQPGSIFTGWGGNCSGTAPTCSVTLNSYRAVTATFEPAPALPQISDASLTGEGIETFLTNNSQINTAARFIAALRNGGIHRFERNWVLMSRSESLQTGTAPSPRVLLPSENGQLFFGFSLTPSTEFPHADPNKIEFIEFVPATNRFRFHEINIAARTVAKDVAACAECHSGRPNWDSYDSWAGMLPFNRDRVYQGSLEAAALRTVFNPWGKGVEYRRLIAQLDLPPQMFRTRGGFNDGRVNYLFDGGAEVLIEPRMDATIAPTTAQATYPSLPAETVRQGGTFFVLYNSAVTSGDEGRGVDVFDNLTPVNARRIAQELIDFPRMPVDVRPIALAISLGCNLESNLTSTAATFYNTRNRVASYTDMENDTRTRRQQLPRLKADMQRFNLMAPASGLIERYGPQTVDSRSMTEQRVRQEMFRRPLGGDANSVTANLMIDREDYGEFNARYRYFLEPLGVPVDKWSLSVHGRSRTYTFADLFDPFVTNAIRSQLATSLGVTDSNCTQAVRNAAVAQFGNLPSVGATPTFTEVQRVFNRNCLECHGTFSAGDGRPFPPILLPGMSHGQLLAPTVGTPRVVPGNLMTSRLFTRITSTAAPMPPAYNGPMLSGADIDLIRRWILAGANP